MPTQVTHIAIAKKVVDKMKLKDGNLVILGAAIVDWSNNYNKDCHIKTHFQYQNAYQENLLSLPYPELFIEKYHNHMEEPIYKGYLIHLLTDYYFNKYIYDNYYLYDDNGNVAAIKYGVNKIKSITPEKATDMKHDDFYELDNYLKIKNYVGILQADGNYEKCKEIEEVTVSEEEYNKDAKIYNDSLKFFKDRGISNTFYNPKLKMFNKYTILKEFNNCVDYIINYMNK